MCRKVILGVLVLLALSSGALARDTSSNNSKQKVILIVGVLDYNAFHDSDVDSLERYLSDLIPDHKIIKIIEKTMIAPIPRIHIKVTDNLAEQIKNLISSSDYEITHLILLDHGNTDLNGKASITNFKFLGGLSEVGVTPIFKKIFEPLSGKFSKDAFVMLESCSTACGPVATSEKRMKAMMDFFKISNGSVFGAHRDMVPHAYEAGFRFQQVRENLLDYKFIMWPVIGSALSQLIYVDKFDGTYSLSRFVATVVGSYLASQIYMYFSSMSRDNSDRFNLGYLYKFNNNQIDKIYDLHPYKNQDELYLKVQPQNIIKEFNSCNFLFH